MNFDQKICPRRVLDTAVPEIFYEKYSLKFE